MYDEYILVNIYYLYYEITKIHLEYLDKQQTFFVCTHTV